MGELLAVIATLCYGAANLAITRGTPRRGGDNGAFVSILCTMVLSAVVWVVSSAGSGWPVLNAKGVLWFCAAGLLTIFIGRVFFYASITRLGAVRASAIKRLNPLFSVILSVLLLGESFDSGMMVGMLMIFGSLGVLVWDSLRQRKQAGTKPEEKRAAAADTAPRSLVATLRNLGFFYGPISALAYAAGNVARKFGVTHLPDPVFGTLLGTIAGTCMFILMGQFVGSYRQAVRNVFTKGSPWLYAAGLLGSVGQILYFYALSHTTISKVALISSMEVFVTIVLSVVIFRSKERIGGPMLLAAALGVLGTVVIVVY
jgi:drug/metabolite transporter (DMT)-like permease